MAVIAEKNALLARKLVKSFGPAVALQEVSIGLKSGEIRALCGENGAGKSTLIKILTGIYSADSGTIEIEGQIQNIKGPQDAQRLGVALVSQELSLAPDLSILDNIWLGHRAVPLFHRRKEFVERAQSSLDQLGVHYDLNRLVRTLTIGERQIVEIARLLVRDAKILILDEPTATLSDVEIEKLINVLRNLRAQGCAVLYVTHRLGEVFKICDTVTVMRNGSVVASEKTSDLNDESLIELMLGRPFEEMYPQGSTSDSSQSLSVKALSIPDAVQDFSIWAPRGSITCIAGQLGAGANSVTRALAGLDSNADFQVELDGRPIALRSRKTRAKYRVSFITEDRAGEGLFRRNVLDNITASQLTSFSNWGILSWRALRRWSKDLCKKVTVDPKRLNAAAFDLSGGNQQKLLFARAIGDHKTGVLLINEPTRGVDVGARAEIYQLLREFCARNYVVLLASSDIEEIAGLSDFVVTMFRGRIVNRYRRGEFDISKILADITKPPALTAAQ